MRTILLLTLVLFVNFSNAQTNTNHIILIDNSGSMQGRPANQGNLNIWKDVKESISDYVSQLDIGDVVTIYKFSAYLSSPKIIEINSGEDRIKLHNYVKNLKATGGTTCLYTSLYQVLEEIGKNEVNGKKLLYVFTDFVEACKGEIYTIDDIKKEINKSNDLEYLYYISFAKGAEDGTKKDTIFKERHSDPDDIFFRFPEKPFNVNLSKQKNAKLQIDIHKDKVLEGTSLYVAFVEEEESIQLVKNSVTINSGKITLEFKIPESYIAAKDFVKKLKVTGNEKLQILQDEIQVEFILPKSDKVALEENSFTIDFYKKRNATLKIKLTSDKNLHNIEIPFKFEIDNKNIEITTEKAIVKSNEISIELAISDAYYAEKDAVGELTFFGNEKLQINNAVVQLKFVLPKKRKVTITFE